LGNSFFSPFNYTFFFTQMALYNQASDLNTRQTVWVSTRVKDRPQLNSHRDDAFGKSLKNHGIDGFGAAELANLHTDYEGWQLPAHKYCHKPGAKRISWVA
jgi:hypothetical protein